MAPRARTIFFTLLTLLGLIAAAAYLLFFHDWRHLAAKYAGKATGREVAIGGDLHIDWGRLTHIQIDHPTIGNMNTGTAPQMFAAEQVAFTVDVMKLLKGDTTLTELRLEKPQLLLEKDEKGNANWQFTKNPAGAVAKGVTPDNRNEFPIVNRLIIHDGAFTFKDPARHVDVTLKTSTVRGKAKEGDNIELKGDGNYNQKPFHLLLHGASVIALRDTDESYPLTVDITIGDTQANIAGTVLDPFQLKGLDLTMRLKGESMSELFPIIGIALPPSPPYDVAGHLSYNETKKIWHFTDFKGRMGGSDLNGNVEWDKSGKRPKLIAQFTSQRLSFADLGNFIGAAPAPKPGQPASPKQVQKATEQQASPYVIPDAPLDISRMAAMDADVEFTGKQVISSSLPLDNFYMKLLLDNKLMTLKPVKFGTADGDISTNLTVNAREEPVRITGDFTFRRLSLARLFEHMKIGNPGNNQGYIGGVAKLEGTGKSLRQMLGSSNGTIGVGMEGGELSNLLIELVGLDIAESLGFLVTGDKPTRIRCVIGDFKVEDGTMHSNALVVDTVDTNIQGNGTVNLKDESMDITLDPHPKDKSVLSLRAPLYVKGTLKHPKISVDKTSLVKRAGVVGALAAIFPPLGALGFIETGLGKDSDCAALIGGMKANTGAGSKVPVNQ